MYNRFVIRRLTRNSPYARTARALNRWRHVQAILVKYGFDTLIEREELRKVREWMGKRGGQRKYIHLTMPERVRMMLQELGPTYVKLGQVLASRSDLLPAEWTFELAKLQDSVPSFSFELVRQIVLDELGKPLEQLFLEFNPEPIAAASISQVHYAVLPNLNQVVVKVQRPGAQIQVQSDIEIIRQVIHQVETRTLWGKRYGVMAILEEFERTLSLELDFRQEATNAVRLRRLMESESRVHVPYIYWELTAERVLTMEYIDGIKIDQLERLDRSGMDRSELARVFINSLAKQLLVDGFFHSDPHPANLLVKPEDGTLVYIDLGQMGRLLPEQRLQLCDLVRSIVRYDSEDVTRLIMSTGTPVRRVDEHKFQRDIDQIIHRYLESSLEQISISLVLAELLGSVMRHGVRLPSELTLAFKAIIQGEQVARFLDEKISILEVLRSASLRVLWQSFDPAQQFDQLSDTLRELNRWREWLPRTIQSILDQLEKGELTLAVDVLSLDHILSTFVIVANRLIAGLVIIGMLIGSALAMQVSGADTWKFIPVLGTIGFVSSSVLGFLLVWSVVSNIIETARARKRDQL